MNGNTHDEEYFVKPEYSMEYGLRSQEVRRELERLAEVIDRLKPQQLTEVHTVVSEILEELEHRGKEKLFPEDESGNREEELDE